MSLAPYFVLWGFVLTTILLVWVGLAWLVFPAPIAAVVRRLRAADAGAAWVAFAVGYQFVFLLPLANIPSFAEVGDPLPLALALAGWLALRVLPGPWRRETVWMAGTVVLWGWLIGAGFLYIAEMQADAALLRDQPLLLVEAKVPPTALLRSRHFFGVTPEHQALATWAMAQLSQGQPLAQDQRTLVRVELIPQLLIHYDLELRRLRAYQWFQAGMLVLLMVAWGFGEQVREARLGQGALE